MTITKDGITVTQMGNFISCSNGETYSLVGTILTGPRGVIAYNVSSMSEAKGIVIGLHGGKRF